MNTFITQNLARHWAVVTMLISTVSFFCITNSVFAIDLSIESSSIGNAPLSVSKPVKKAITRITLMPPESELDVRYSYKKSILEAALEATRDSHGDYEIIIKPGFVKDIRAFHELIRTGDSINVLFAITTKEREELAIPIRIPLRKSLVSYRLLMIPKSQADRFANIKTLDELKQLSAGLRKTWISAQAFEANDLKYAHTEERIHLFSMLARGRFDYIPLGVNEIYKELDLRKDTLPELMIAPNIALFVNIPLFTFVSPNEPELAQRLEQGFELIVKSGEFDRLFEAEFADDIQRAQLHKRHIISIPNTLLPDDLPLERTELWYKPAS